MSDVRLTGGCQCGAIRYAIHEMPFQIGVCHCRMCQKAYGAPFAANFTVKKTNLEFTRGQPAVFKSSAKMERGFCRDCGTPLYANYVASADVFPSTGSLDDPSTATPEFQMGIESRLAWTNDIAGLKAMSAEDAYKGNTGTVEEIRATNRQHPDHDTEAWPPAA
jgi:hypothetical protein